MSLHFLDENPRRLAEAHKTKDLKPAAQQVAQALCNAAVRYNSRERTPMQPNYKLEPLTDWAASSRSNWRHMVEVGFALIFEYSWREGKTIEDAQKTLNWARSKIPYNMPERGLQSEPYYGDDEFLQHASDPINIWRISYVDNSKADPDDWGEREMPDWFADCLRQLISGRKQLIETKNAESNETQKS